jgi:hypothetical protein
MLTLEQELECLDNQIAGIRAAREASHDNGEREQLGRQIEMLNIHERAAIRKVHSERAARQAADDKAAADYQKAQAAKREQADRSMLRRRWKGDDASFEEAWPELIKQHRIDVALGRDVGSDMLAPQVRF